MRIRNIKDSGSYVNATFTRLLLLTAQPRIKEQLPQVSTQQIEGQSQRQEAYVLNRSRRSQKHSRSRSTHHPLKTAQATALEAKQTGNAQRAAQQQHRLHEHEAGLGQ